MNILITAGATREPLDAVRFLSNLSTGSTGAALADALVELGHTVTLLHGEGAAHPKRPCERATFSSTVDLWSQLERHLSGGRYDAVIMNAAVSDYRPATIHPGKISSHAAEITLTLMRNPKILPQLKQFSPRPVTVVGFKLTVGADAAERRSAVMAQFAGGGVDCVVQNDLHEIQFAVLHPFRLFRTAEGEAEVIAGTSALAVQLFKL